MSMPKLKVDIRQGKGKRFANQIRKEGFVPGVVYGHNKETKSIKVNDIEMEKTLRRYGQSATFNIEMGGENIPVIIKEVQRGIVKDNLLHVDFQQLSAGEKIKMSIPIHLQGKEKVETSATILQQQINALDIQCLPKDIPHFITVDVSNLEIGKPLEVGHLDIVNNEEIEILNDYSGVVASLTSVTKEEECEEEEIPIYESQRSVLE